MSRPVVLVALLAILVVFAAVAALTVPWHVLAGSHPHAAVSHDFSPADVSQERAFHAALRPMAYAGLLVGLAVAGVLGLTPLGGRLIVAAGRPFGGGWVSQVLVGSVLVAVIGRLATLPFDLRAEAVLRDYGLSTQNWSGWLLDSAKGLAVSAVTTGLVLCAVVALARHFPRTWWALAATLVAAFVVLASFSYPLVVEPVFNRFTPMADGRLRTELLGLAQRDGVPIRDVLVADASRRTTALNAYVSGFGGTRRIVVYDTLLAQASRQEVEVVVAHELGHAKRGDVLHGTLLGALGAAAAVCALALLLTWPALLRRAAVSGPGDPRMLALVLFLVMAGSLALQPGSNLVSRRIESRADVHAMQLTCDLPSFVASQRRLALANLSDLDPSPVVYAFFFTHPTAPERLALAREYARLHC